MLSRLMSAVAFCALLGAAPAHAEEALNWSANGVEFRNGDVRATLGGRLHLDAASIDDGASDIDDEEVRRARLELAVRFGDDWQLRVDREFTNGGGWRNVWLRYNINDHFNIKAGNFIAPFSMEDVGSSNDTMFMERSLAQALAPGFGVGVAASYEGRHFTISGGYFDDPIDAEDNIQAQKGNGISVRGTWTPVEHRNTTLHVGIGLERRELDSGAVRGISSGPEASLAPTVVRTGPITDIDTSMSYNLEAAYSTGPFLFQAQYISSDLNRNVGGDQNFSGYYAQVGWIVTGERHRYGDTAGTFLSPRPRSKWGAVELAARISSLDLGEAGASGGQADDVTAGVNWYLGANVRFVANYVHSEVDAVNPLLDRDINVVQGRFQLDF